MDDTVDRKARAARRGSGQGLAEAPFGFQPALALDSRRGTLPEAVVTPAPAPAEAEEPPPGYLGHRARMRQKLLAAGPDALLDHELLEVVLFVALPRRDTKPIARALIGRFGSFANAIAAPALELRTIPGLGEAGIAALKTVQGAALRLARAEVIDQPVLNSWDRLISYLTATLSRERVEHVHVLYLDSRNRLIADEAQARGTVNHTPVYPREVVKRALELQSTALILVHNHPSGDPSPSRADIDMTAEIAAAAKVFGIVVHDHLIIGNGRQLSFRREGLL
ncbi:DNA repair protein RadC [Siccirubricoccus deserti]|uniref:DNA repair protein RadC n=1 Tax=Siccirubricoccus deserti TaxID=2013562 RepID=A0A9X0UDW4_9PROT|nr:DNA repair protein RadC [Siccirubricoccus deserti]MBC4016902.1 DNA repair protein RadC [Siccirubricoccus deserti]GGC53641.1 DNA repair protein RadC [Siccirubricoccus deserti]